MRYNADAMSIDAPLSPATNPIPEWTHLVTPLVGTGSILIDGLGDVVAVVPKDALLPLMTELKSNSKLGFSLLVDLTAVDYMDSRDSRYEVVYHLMSIQFRYRLRVKVEVAEANPNIASVSSLWSAGLFLEREIWDMFGITFAGHPDLRRILLYEEFKGHPLRKDYPIQGKQPRVALRYPEVENTARQMRRPELVSITRRNESGKARV